MSKYGNVSMKIVLLYGTIVVDLQEYCYPLIFKLLSSV